MLLAVSECTSKPSTGTVDGVFETLGGLATAGHHDLPGTVVFTNGQRSHSSVKVGANGAFSIDLFGSSLGFWGVCLSHADSLL